MDVSHLSRVEGPSLRLRLIRPEDAGYVHRLRCDPAYNRHLSEVRGGPDDQRRWIEAYKQREAEGHEFYYVIERRSDGAPCGVVRLYDIGTDSFTWGSFILDAGKPRKAALESAVLSFGIGFETLALETASIDVRIENTHAHAFYVRLGMQETHRTERDIYMVYTRSRFAADKAGYMSLLGQQGPV